MSNVHESLARHRKAQAISARLLVAHRGLETDLDVVTLARTFKPEEWLAVAEAAGQNAPSAETQRLVLEMLERAVGAAVK